MRVDSSIVATLWIGKDGWQGDVLTWDPSLDALEEKSDSKWFQHTFDSFLHRCCSTCVKSNFSRPACLPFTPSLQISLPPDRHILITLPLLHSHAHLGLCHSHLAQGKAHLLALPSFATNSSPTCDKKLRRTQLSVHYLMFYTLLKLQSVTANHC